MLIIEKRLRIIFFVILHVNIHRQCCLHNKCADIKVHVGFTQIFVYSSISTFIVQTNVFEKVTNHEKCYSRQCIKHTNSSGLK